MNRDAILRKTLLKFTHRKRREDVGDDCKKRRSPNETPDLAKVLRFVGGNSHRSHLGQGHDELKTRKVLGNTRRRDAWRRFGQGSGNIK